MSDFWKRFRRDRLAVFGLGVIVIFVAAAILAPWLAPYDPSEQFFDGLTLEGSPLPPMRGSGSAPTPMAATSSRACFMGRRRRCSSVLSPMALRY